MVFNNFVVAPDLVVDSITTSGSAATVVVKNIGNQTSTDAFWVDLFVNPSTVPAVVNDTLEALSAEGHVWGVEDVQIAPGEMITLTSGGDHFEAVLSTFSANFQSGDTLYVHVDSADIATTFGAIEETHERIGATYNNITSYTVP